MLLTGVHPLCKCPACLTGLMTLSIPQTHHLAIQPEFCADPTGKAARRIRIKQVLAHVLRIHIVRQTKAGIEKGFEPTMIPKLDCKEVRVAHFQSRPPYPSGKAPVWKGEKSNLLPEAIFQH